MKRLAALIPLIPLVALIGALFYALLVVDRAADTARAESARLRRSNDSLAVLQSRVDTVTVERTRTLTRWRDSTVTLRESLTVTDTVEVIRFIATQDSVITACVAVVESCEEGKRVRDRRIAVLDSLNRDTEQRLTRERRIGWRDKALAVGLGYLVGRLTP